MGFLKSHICQRNIFDSFSIQHCAWLTIYYHYSATFRKVALVRWPGFVVIFDMKTVPLFFFTHLTSVYGLLSQQHCNASVGIYYLTFLCNDITRLTAKCKDNYKAIQRSWNRGLNKRVANKTYRTNHFNQRLNVLPTWIRAFYCWTVQTESLV